MKQLICFSILFILGFSACDCSYQYDVYVKNATVDPIRVVFKSSQDRNNKEEQSVTLAPGAIQRVISSSDIDVDNNCSGTSADHCSLVADYINVFQGATQSKKEWCDASVQFSKTDIQQAEFTLEVTTACFE